MYYVYIIQCKDKSLYTGITTDVSRRFEEHKQGIGSNYTKAKKAVKLVFVEESLNRSLASKREAEIKNFKRAQKLELVKKWDKSLLKT